MHKVPFFRFEKGAGSFIVASISFAVIAFLFFLALGSGMKAETCHRSKGTVVQNRLHVKKEHFAGIIYKDKYTDKVLLV